jgi:uncharacterized membrane protein (DUF441 family)
MKYDTMSIGIAIGQAVNILAQRGVNFHDETKQQVLELAKFILECKTMALATFNEETGGDL